MFEHPATYLLSFAAGWVTGKGLYSYWLARRARSKPAEEITCDGCLLMAQQNAVLESRLQFALRERLSAINHLAAANAEREQLLELARRTRRLDVLQSAGDVIAVVFTLELVREQLAVVAPLLRTEDQA